MVPNIPSGFILPEGTVDVVFTATVLILAVRHQTEQMAIGLQHT